MLRQRSQPFYFTPFPEKDRNTHFDTDYLNNAKAVNANCRIAANVVKSPDRPTSKTT